MSNEEGSDKRASSLEDSSVANLNESVSISKDNGEAKGATRKKTTKNSNMDKTKNRINIEKQNNENFEMEKLIVENGIGNHGDNIVENSRVETLIAGPRIEKSILDTGHSRLEMRSCHTLVEDADAWRL
ncbi:hypothetical protein PV328_012397, partial [Microctonus aethiopoides]